MKNFTGWLIIVAIVVFAGRIIFVTKTDTALLLPANSRDLSLFKKYFEAELQPWTKSFNNFNLSNFKIADTVAFENSSEQDFKKYSSFIALYKPLLSYSTDSSQFIDIYSYQLNLVKRGQTYYASPDVDQTVYLCNPKTRYWNRIYFGTPGGWIDEATWISKEKFILAGITKSADGKSVPVVLVGDTGSQRMETYQMRDTSCFQNAHGYTSPKLKRIPIDGL